MSPVSSYRMKGRVVLRQIGDDSLLVPIQGEVAKENCVFPVNETGVLLWKAFTAGESLEVAANALVRTFDVSVETARDDVQSFLIELLERQLLEEIQA